MSVQIENIAALGRIVRQVRTGMGLTQPDLAMTAGVGLRFIVEVEKGKPTAQIGKVLRVLRTLGITVVLTPPPGLEAGDGTPT
jgi:HTH-type transcriptional regulator/antitoxin HipB